MMNFIPLHLFFIIFHRPAFADFGDSVAQALFQKKVDQIYQKALQCEPREKDLKFKLDVTDWIKIQPKLPSWYLLTDLEKVATDSRKYAKSIGGNDKTLHCLAGCYITQKLDYSSAVLVGWYKELIDASDCSKKSSFEKKDFDATVLGARLGRSDKDCKTQCK